MTYRPTRRRFVKQTAVGVAAPMMLTQSLRGAPANSKLNIAGVGVGGKGWGDINATSKGQNVVAVCDVDEKRLGKAAQKFTSAKAYTDWRRLLEQKDIDAVTVSTPDHMHAPIALSAMQLGKHVYVQKPMSHSVHEARQLMLAARDHKVVTQMGNQGHSGPGYRTLVKLAHAGVIGKIKEAHAWSNRPIWPQGVKRPTGEDPVPKDLHWDHWIGVAPYRPYRKGVYNPFKWRGWIDFGTGALGDMGCHIIDPVYWSLGLSAPKQVWYEGEPSNGETYPKAGVIRYIFPGTEFTTGDTVEVTWHDGGNKPTSDMAYGAKIPSNGSLLIGEKGALLTKHHGMPQLLPTDQFKDFDQPTVPGSDHYMQWTNACLGKDKATSHFDYAGPLTETVLLGNVAIRLPGQKLDWDAKAMRVTNVDEANQYLRRPYREGWAVPRVT